MADRYPLIVNTSAAQIQELASGDNLNLTGSSISAVVNITASGSLTVNSAAAVTAIINGATTGVGNIGSSTTAFNTVFAKATTAQYADLAEKYTADSAYPIGTVLKIGGDAEVTTEGQVSHDSTVIGTVSENPAHLMNSTLESAYVAIVALTGRVPCRVIGAISRGDCIVASDTPGLGRKLDPEQWRPGCVLGKALTGHSGSGEGLIEIVIGQH